MRKIALALLMGALLLTVPLVTGCDEPDVRASITIPVSNQVGALLPPGILEAALGLINGQLAQHLPAGTVVTLVPATSARNLVESGGPRIILVPGEALEAVRVGNLIRVSIPPNFDPNDPGWRDLLTQKVIEVVSQ